MLRGSQKEHTELQSLNLQANFSTWWILNKASMWTFLELWPSFVSNWRNENYHYIALDKAYSQIDPIYRSKFYPVLFTCKSRKKKLNTIPWRWWDCASAYRLLSMFSLEVPLSSICCSLALVGAGARPGLPWAVRADTQKLRLCAYHRSEKLVVTEKRASTEMWKVLLFS